MNEKRRQEPSRSADRYASEAEAIEQDDTRATCLLAARHGCRELWADDGYPEDTSDQLRDIAHAAHGGSPGSY